MCGYTFQKNTVFIQQIRLFEILITTGYNQQKKHGFSSNMHIRLSFTLFWAFSCNYILNVYILLDLTFSWISVFTGYHFLTSFSTAWLLGFLIRHSIPYKRFLFLNHISVLVALLLASILVSAISSLEYSNICDRFLSCFEWYLNSLKGGRILSCSSHGTGIFLPLPVLFVCSNTVCECNILMIKQTTSSFCKSTVMF